MNRPQINCFTRTLFMMSLVLWVLGGSTAFSQTSEGNTPGPPPTVQEEPIASGDQDEVIERGIRGHDHRKLPKVTPGKVPRGVLERPRQPAQPQGGLPPNLCQQVTHMVPQCRCSNPTDCQVLTGLCPGSCPAGSQTCQCSPMFRGTPPPLPPSLCGYQVPIVMTQCSCSNAADCQVLSPFCPGACPVGSLSCQCNPLQRR